MGSAKSPEEIAQRVLRISRLNGWSVALFAGLCGLVSLTFGDLIGFVVGSLVAAGGGCEVYGNRMLQRGDSTGMRWLIRGQFVVLGVIWIYALARLATVDVAYLQRTISPDMRDWLNQLGLSAEEALQTVCQLFRLVYVCVMAATLIYQGGLAFYYHRRTAVVIQALRTTLAPPAEKRLS